MSSLQELLIRLCASLKKKSPTAFLHKSLPRLLYLTDTSSSSGGAAPRCVEICDQEGNVPAGNEIPRPIRNSALDRVEPLFRVQIKDYLHRLKGLLGTPIVERRTVGVELN